MEVAQRVSASLWSVARGHYGILQDDTIYLILVRGAFEVLNYRITVGFFENYRNTVINFFYEYRHRSIFYQQLYFPVTVG